MNRDIAATVHRLPQHVLARLVPERVDWFVHQQDVRRQLAGAAMTSRVPLGSWQDAWNTLTGATPQRPGRLHLPPTRCPDCHGRGWSVRAASRGRPGGVCLACHGSRRTRSRDVTALYAATPDQDR